LRRPSKQIGSTLSILGFESSRAVIADQVEAIHAAVNSGSFDDVLLLGVASALLQVDENLAGIAQQRSGLSGTSEASGLINDAQVAVLARREPVSNRSNRPWSIMCRRSGIRIAWPMCRHCWLR
jgi:hypothetical protein